MKKSVGKFPMKSRSGHARYPIPFIFRTVKPSDFANATARSSTLTSSLFERFFVSLALRVARQMQHNPVLPRWRPAPHPAQ
jgi:hypothetical protein